MPTLTKLLKVMLVILICGPLVPQFQEVVLILQPMMKMNYKLQLEQKDQSVLLIKSKAILKLTNQEFIVTQIAQKILKVLTTQCQLLDMAPQKKELLIGLLKTVGERTGEMKDISRF